MCEERGQRAGGVRSYLEPSHTRQARMVQCAGVRAAAVTLARLSRPCRVFGARNQTCSRAGHPALLSVLWQQSFPMSSKTRVLATSHAAQQGPVDEWLVAQVCNALTAITLCGAFSPCSPIVPAASQVDIIVSAMPAMQGPPDQASLKQLMRAAENLDSSRSLCVFRAASSPCAEALPRLRWNDDLTLEPHCSCHFSPSSTGASNFRSRMSWTCNTQSSISRRLRKHSRLPPSVKEHADARARVSECLLATYSPSRRHKQTETPLLENRVAVLCA